MLSISYNLSAQEERPNFLFLVIEDTSPFLLPAYGNSLIETPNINFLAENGVVFTNATSNAPYCSPSRSTLISGSYASTYATDWHRNPQIVPQHYFFPQYLRNAGYFTVNAGKTDYNVSKEVAEKYLSLVWDKMSGYRKEGKPNASYNDPGRRNKPFFAQFNNHTTHMSRMTTVTLEGREPLQHLDPEVLTVPPHVPDLPAVRADYALHMEGVEDADKWVGYFLDDLRERNLLENTIIFLFSDHGGCLPRGKAFPFETGLRPALIIYAPEKWKHVLPANAGTTSERLVEFADFGPTLLSLAGIRPPKHMQGKAFMGEFEEKPRTYSFAMRTNTGYHFDPSRIVFDGRYQYIRYFTPYKIHGLRQSFQWGMPANLAWDSLYHAGNAQPQHRRHFERKPVEMLFDTRSDPYGMKNLADDPRFRGKLSELRKALSGHVSGSADLGFFPKDVRNEFLNKGISLYEWVKDTSYKLDRLHEAVYKASSGDKEQLGFLTGMLANERPEIRFWACSGLAYLARLGKMDSIPEGLYQLLGAEKFQSVSATAAEALVYAGDSKTGLKRLLEELEEKNEYAISSLEELGSAAEPCVPELKRLSAQSKSGQIRFGARSILINLGELPLHDLFEKKQVNSFMKGHRSRVANWAPTLP